MKNAKNNNSRRGFLRAGVALVGAAGVIGASQARELLAEDQPQKLPKSAVQYQDKPKGEQRCNVCVNFVPPNACKIVEGQINPIGWCAAFAPKST